MVAVAVEVDPEPGSTLARLQAIHDELSQLTTSNPVPLSDADRLELIAAGERLAAAVAALQATLLVRFARQRARSELDRAGDDADPRAIQASVVDQLAMGCRVSPSEAGRRLATARTLTTDLPETFALLRSGRVSARVAESVVAASRHLDPAGRQAVDGAVVRRRIDACGPRAAAALALRCAYEHDPAAFVARGRHARGDRRVGLRPAPDTMAVLTGYLPVEQGVACPAALRRRTDTLKAAGDQRSRDQIMADTLVERVTGQATAADVDVEVQLLVPLETLTGESDRAPVLSGFGPIPPGTAWEIIASGSGRRWWRRLFTRESGSAEAAVRTIVGGDRRRRLFDDHLRRLITARDQSCRAPYCDAPIRHVDHIRSFADGGPTTLANAQGLCERHNHTKELPGWRVTRVNRVVIEFRTPTGHHYASRAPDPP